MFIMHCAALRLRLLDAASTVLVLITFMTVNLQGPAPAKVPHNAVKRMIWNLFISDFQRSDFMPLRNPIKSRGPVRPY